MSVELLELRQLLLELRASLLPHYPGGDQQEELLDFLAVLADRGRQVPEVPRLKVVNENVELPEVVDEIVVASAPFRWNPDAEEFFPQVQVPDVPNVPD